MYRVCGSRLYPNFGVWSVADNNFYLRITVDEMDTLEVFTHKHLRLRGCKCTIFTAVVYYKNPKTEIKNEIIKI